MEFVTGILLLTFVFTEGAELPSTFKICKQNDPNLEKCFAEAATQAIQVMASGIESLKLSPIDPLSINRVSIGQGKDTFFSLEQEYQNCTLHGLSKGLKISNYKIDLEKLIFSSESFNPQVDFVANYTVKGQIYRVSIDSKGHSNITMLNLKTQNTFYGEKFKKNGEIYMRLTNYDVKFAPEKVLMNFKNPNGEQPLEVYLNNFISQTANYLFKELKVHYEKAFGREFTEVANKIITQVPLNKILPVS